MDVTKVQRPDDWVFTQYYPVLRGGKGKGEGAIGGMHSDLSMDN